MRVNFECLYFLDNNDLCIIEIKKYVTDDASAAQRYQWLLINKKSLIIKPLQFRSMDASGDLAERFFDLGYLKFDPKSGVFIEKFNSGQHSLCNKTCEEVPDEYLNAIAGFLSN